MSLLAFNMNHHPHCFYLFLFFLGCLAPDLGQNIPIQSAFNPQQQVPQTRAPLKIDPTILQNRTFNEAPMFSEQVKRGKLPPVSERLPENPLVIVPIEEIGTYGGTLSRALVAAPKHILSSLHPKYNPKTDYNAFREATTNAQLLMQPGIPRISAWIPVEWIRGQRIIYERNPYYWKIDTAGNQLPYADHIIFNVIQDPQVILLKFINGELDLIGRYTRIDMFPTLKVKEKNGKFNLRITGPNRGPAYHLNWDAPRLALREAFRNKNVRIALSHAVNREEIDEIVFHGLLDPSGYSFGPISPYFSPEAYKKYAEYDPDKARRLLDREDYIDTDGDGIRELRDGSRFELTIDFVHPDLHDPRARPPHGKRPHHHHRFCVPRLGCQQSPGQYPV